MNIGKLYQVKEYFWLLYPSTDIAVAVAREHETRRGRQHTGADGAAARPRMPPDRFAGAVVDGLKRAVYRAEYRGDPAPAPRWLALEGLHPRRQEGPGGGHPAVRGGGAGLFSRSA